MEPIKALTLLAEAGGLRRFNHHRQFSERTGLARYDNDLTLNNPIVPQIGRSQAMLDPHAVSL